MHGVSFLMVERSSVLIITTINQYIFFNSGRWELSISQRCCNLGVEHEQLLNSNYIFCYRYSATATRRYTQIPKLYINIEFVYVLGEYQFGHEGNY